MKSLPLRRQRTELMMDARRWGDAADRRGGNASARLTLAMAKSVLLSGAIRRGNAIALKGGGSNIQGQSSWQGSCGKTGRPL